MEAERKEKTHLLQTMSQDEDGEEVCFSAFPFFIFCTLSFSSFNCSLHFICRLVCVPSLVPWVGVEFVVVAFVYLSNVNLIDNTIEKEEKEK